jgi:hypothetical protein
MIQTMWLFLVSFGKHTGGGFGGKETHSLFAVAKYLG